MTARRTRTLRDLAAAATWGLSVVALALAGCGSTGGATPGQGGKGGGAPGATGGAPGGGAGTNAGMSGGSGRWGRSSSGGAGAEGATGGATAGAGGVAGTGGAGVAGASAGGAGVGGVGFGGAGSATGGAGGLASNRPLGMNDLTILTPLPQSAATPVLLRATDLADDGTVLVPRALFDQVVRDRDSTSGEPLFFTEAPYERLQVVAVRFDLCDRHLPGPCPTAEDGRMRLVLQPLSGTPPMAADVGFHAFYAIGNDELPGAVAALRALAALAALAPPSTSGGTQPGNLRVSPALSAPSSEAYASKLRAFVRRYGGEARLLRLTLNAQNLKSAAIAWVLQGAERRERGGPFADMTIVGATQLTQRVLLSGTSSFDVVPMVDLPAGLQSALSQAVFDRADTTQKRALLGALVALENPLTHTAETVPCVGCHVSTLVMAARAGGAALDPLTLPGRYASPLDLSTAGGQSASTPRTIRALGYFQTTVLISQRVVNETSQSLAELEQRFPAP